MCSHLLSLGVFSSLLFPLQLPVFLFLRLMNAEHLEQELGLEMLEAAGLAEEQPAEGGGGRFSQAGQHHKAQMWQVCLLAA